MEHVGHKHAPRQNGGRNFPACTWANRGIRLSLQIARKNPSKGLKPVINRFFGLFRRYAHRHARMQKPGFPLLDGSGNLLGNIDPIRIQEGRLWIEGWTLSELVGLSNGFQTVEISPSQLRSDTLTNNSELDGALSNFKLDLALSNDQTIFWSERDGTRQVWILPAITPRDLNAMRRAQIAPFLSNTIRALPAGVHWLLYRDPQSAARIKTALGLGIVKRSVQLNALLFGDDVTIEDRQHTDLSRTEITIVIPIYNAFDLLHEMLARVRDHTDLDWRLIMVEDCSSDLRVRPWLRDWQASLTPDVAVRVTVIENETNLGFIHSVNRALIKALAFGNHVVLLNSDAFVPARWASRLIRPLLENDNVASVTPMSNDAEIFNIPIICQREAMLPGEADAIDKVAGEFFSGCDLAYAPTGVGFCMAIHIDFLRKIPAFDTAFGRGYGEEVDWCQKVRQKGGRHLGLGGLFVEHHGGNSFGSAQKLKMIRKNGEIITRRYPRYDADVQDFIRNDPLTTPRLALALVWAGIRQRGAVPIYVAHDLGGGAEHYLRDRLTGDLVKNTAAVVLRVGGLSRWQIELHTSHGITCGETDNTRFMVRLLSLLPVRQIVYSCAVGDRDPISLPEILLSLAQGLDDRIEVLFHDYLPLSPAYTLLGSDGIYHGVPMPKDADPAHTTLRADGTKATLSDWRIAWGKLLDAAHAVTVFSDNSQRIVSTAYPQVAEKLTVTPHRLLHIVPRTRPGQTRDGIPVIGVLGNIGYHKGIAVLRGLSELLVKNGRARLVVIGETDPAYPLARSAQIHGSYRIEDIPTLVAVYGIGCWLIPSIWPETFSYTTHEALATGLPVFSFDLGAQGDAVRAAASASGQGGSIHLFGSEINMETLLETLLKGHGA